MARGKDNMKGRIAFVEITREGGSRSSSRVIFREGRVFREEDRGVFGGYTEWMMGGEEGPVVDGGLSQSAFVFPSPSRNMQARKHVPRQSTARAKGPAGSRKRSRPAALWPGEEAAGNDERRSAATTWTKRKGMDHPQTGPE